MNIYIVPKVCEPYYNQVEFSVDFKLVSFLKYLKPKSKIEVLYTQKKIENNSLIVFSGGNNIIKFSNKLADKSRHKLDNYFFKLYKKKNIKFLGICHGAHFIASKFNGNFRMTKNGFHLKPHDILHKNKKIKINSYHNIVIDKFNQKLEVISRSSDNTIELFKHKKYKILGIMWHPERYKKFKKFDKLLINKFL